MASRALAPAGLDCRSRALAIWPGLDTRKLRRTGGDPVRIARLVERRTALPLEAIVKLLTGEGRQDSSDDGASLAAH
jgi:hypothetical protein